MAIPLTVVEATAYHSVTLWVWKEGSEAEARSVKLRLGEVLETAFAGQGLPDWASSESATTTMRSFALDVVSPGRVKVLPAMAASPPTTPSTLKDGEGVGSAEGLTEGSKGVLGAGAGVANALGELVGKEAGIGVDPTAERAGGVMVGIEGPGREERVGGVKCVDTGTGTLGATGARACGIWLGALCDGLAASARLADPDPSDLEPCTPGLWGAYAPPVRAMAP